MERAVSVELALARSLHARLGNRVARRFDASSCKFIRESGYYYVGPEGPCTVVDVLERRIIVNYRVNDVWVSRSDTAINRVSCLLSYSDPEFPDCLYEKVFEFLSREYDER